MRRHVAAEEVGDVDDVLVLSRANASDRERGEDRRVVVLANTRGDRQRIVGDGGVADAMQVQPIIHLGPADDAPRRLGAGKGHSANASGNGRHPTQEQEVAIEQRIGDLEEPLVVDLVDADTAFLGLRFRRDHLGVGARPPRLCSGRVLGRAIGRCRVLLLTWRCGGRVLREGRSGAGDEEDQRADREVASHMNRGMKAMGSSQFASNPAAASGPSRSRSLDAIFHVAHHEADDATVLAGELQHEVGLSTS